MLSPSTINYTLSSRFDAIASSPSFMYVECHKHLFVYAGSSWENNMYFYRLVHDPISGIKKQELVTSMSLDTGGYSSVDPSSSANIYSSSQIYTYDDFFGAIHKVNRDTDPTPHEYKYITLWKYTASATNPVKILNGFDVSSIDAGIVQNLPPPSDEVPSFSVSVITK